MDWRVARLCGLIQANPSEFKTRSALGDFARSVNLSLSRLRHLFKQEVGAPVGQFVKAWQLYRAAELLDRAPLRIKEVLVVLGLNDRSHFSRDFKCKYGVSPRAYRMGTCLPRKTGTGETVVFRLETAETAGSITPFESPETEMRISSNAAVPTKPASPVSGASGGGEFQSVANSSGARSPRALRGRIRL